MPGSLRRTGCGCLECTGGRDSALAGRTEPRWGRMARPLPRSPPARSRSSCTATVQRSRSSRRPSAVRESAAEPQGYPGCGRRNPSAAPPRTQSWLRARWAPPLRVLARRSHLQEEVPWSSTRLQVALWEGLYSVAEGHIMENRSLDTVRGPMGKWLGGKTRPGSPGDLPPSPAGAGAATCCCQPRSAGRGLFS